MSEEYKPFQFVSLDDLNKKKQQDAAKKSIAESVRASSTPAQKLSEDELLLQEQIRAISAQERSQKRILVVDDDKHFTASLSRLLKTYAFTVEAINDPKHTFDHVASFKPDLVILDLKMPGMSGSSVAAQLSQNPETKNIPVIILSGLISVYDSTHNRRTGNNQYFMAKTAEPQEWVDKINLLIDESQG